jgi:hypothetical protein
MTPCWHKDVGPGTSDGAKQPEAMEKFSVFLAQLLVIISLNTTRGLGGLL